MSKKKYIILILVALFTFSLGADAQQIQTVHKVKKRETIFGIARDYNITIEDLIGANPEMQQPGYELKKGSTINIPFPKQNTQQPAETAPVAPIKTSLDIGVMLPLHNVDGDGRRMIEYYRGLLMAVEKLKADGISINVRAWNVAQTDDINTTLIQQGADKSDIIFGPLYSKQVKALGDFCKKNKIRMVIPFSINGDEVERNEFIYQVYQPAETFNQKSVTSFIDRFSNCHPIIIDCNDSTSNKGTFTYALRKKLEERGIQYSITNLRSSIEMFEKAFSTTKRNVVILNTGRSPELTQTMHKLDALLAHSPGYMISMFGYTEWQMYEKYNQNQTYFHKYDVYIPSSYFFNEQSGYIQSFQNAYKSKFGVDMMNALPHFALTGYDQGVFFIGGVYKFKGQFYGARNQIYNTSLQTPYHFSKTPNGGFRNDAYLLVHYQKSGGIETINY
jgi:ABC-type branched-subunit amino acid transport system substrate-binding protein